MVLSMLALFAALFVAAFAWNESRKEVVYLCGNFTRGVSGESVRRQLDTGIFLNYQSSETPSGSRIEMHSKYNLSVYRCNIDLDADGNVIEARVE